jgi:hypothetical protein
MTNFIAKQQSMAEGPLRKSNSESLCLFFYNRHALLISKAALLQISLVGYMQDYHS